MIDEDEHRKAIADAISKVSRAMRADNTPLDVGLSAMLTLSSMLICTMCKTKEDAEAAALDAGAAIVGHVLDHYDHERADFLAFRKPQ